MKINLFSFEETLLSGIHEAICFGLNPHQANRGQI